MQWCVSLPCGGDTADHAVTASRGALTRRAIALVRQFNACLLGWLVMQGPVHASELTITATYKGSVSKTGGQFTNTTPESGICADYPADCPPGYFSILFPWSGNLSRFPGIGYKVGGFTSSPDQFVYFDFDSSTQTINVSNETGDAKTLALRIDAIGFYNAPAAVADPLSNPAYANPQGTNCRVIAPPQYRRQIGNTADVYAMYGSISPGATTCWVKPTRVGYSYYSRMSFRYVLQLDKPWSWSPGVYRGSYTFGYRDLYLGTYFQGDVRDDVVMNFVLTVQPDMYVHFPTNQGGVVNAELLPPGGWTPGGSSSWPDRWPPYLSVDVPFDFGTIGSVKMNLVCQNPVGDTCGIVDTSGGVPLAVDTFLTDRYLNDDRGVPAINSRLSTSSRTFTPITSTGSGVTEATLTFKTQTGATRHLLAGHTYGGLVTVVFDSDLP